MQPRTGRSAAVALVIVAAAVSLSGCADPGAYTQVLSSSGTGSGSLAITASVADSHVFTVSFFCTSGAYRIVVREAPHVEMAGDCGQRQTYDVPIPPTHTVHLSIGVQQDSTYTVRAGFRN
jgi:hypothetical protein